MRRTVPTGTIFDWPRRPALGYLTYSLRTDSGRIATLSHNPYLRGATQAEITGILATALCRAA